MINKEDIKLIVGYFKENVIPSGLEKTIKKLELLLTIQNANDELSDLMKDGE